MDNEKRCLEEGSFGNRIYITSETKFVYLVEYIVKFFIKIETHAQVFSCEFCKIPKKTFFTEHLRWLLLEVLGQTQFSSLEFDSEGKSF